MFSPLAAFFIGTLGFTVFGVLLFDPKSKFQWLLATMICLGGGVITVKAGLSRENLLGFPVALTAGFLGLTMLDKKAKARQPVDRLQGKSIARDRVNERSDQPPQIVPPMDQSTSGKRRWVRVDGSVEEMPNLKARQEPAIGPGFAAVAGMTDLKSKLMEAASEAIGQGTKQTRNGILLYGEPGNGKTFIVEALAQQLRVPLLTMSVGEVTSQWVGATAVKAMERIAQAKASAPCVLFLDEADSLLEQRNSSGSHADSAAANRDHDQTVNALLTEIVNLRGTGVVLIAATNFIDKLDAAAIREGRFDFKIEVTSPDEPARIGLLTTGLANNARDITVPEDVVLTTAKRWKGFSVKRILAVTEQVPRYCKRTGKQTLVYDDLKAVLREVQGAKAAPPEGTKNLDELVLIPSQRDKLQALAKRLQRTFELEQAGGSMPTGLLFSGPPGTGKTETARSLAKASGWAFLSTSGNDLINDPSRIDKMWREAMNLRPAIVFIDEADDLLADRAYSGARSVTNKFLTVMDGSGGKIPDLLWIAATNHPDAIDSAALRGGRFTEKVEFAPPDVESMTPWIQSWLAGKGWHCEVAAVEIARRLDGQSIANVAAILQQAVNDALTSSENFEVRRFGESQLQSAIKTVLG